MYYTYTHQNIIKTSYLKPSQHAHFSSIRRKKKKALIVPLILSLIPEPPLAPISLSRKIKLSVHWNEPQLKRKPNHNYWNAHQKLIPKVSILKDQSKRVYLTPLSNRKAAGRRPWVHLAVGSWRAVGCFLRLHMKRGRALSGHHLSTRHSHQRWACERENHGPPGLGRRAKMRRFHFSNKQTKVWKSHTRGRFGTASCRFSSLQLRTYLHFSQVSSSVFQVSLTLVSGLHFASALCQTARRWGNEDQKTSAPELVLQAGEGRTSSQRALASSFPLTYKWVSFLT